MTETKDIHALGKDYQVLTNRDTTAWDDLIWSDLRLWKAKTLCDDGRP